MPNQPILLALNQATQSTLLKPSANEAPNQLTLLAPNQVILLVLPELPTYKVSN